MNITIERDAAIKAMQSVAAVAPKRSPIPILSSVLLSAADDAVTMIGTDNTIEIRTSAPCRVAAGGDVVIEADRFREVLRNLPSGADLAISDSDDAGSVVIKCGRFRCKIPTLPAGDFPLFEPRNVSCSFEIASDQLALMLDDTMFNISVDTAKLMMAGASMQVHEDQFRIIGLQSQSPQAISYRSTPAPIGAQDLIPTTVPLPALRHLRSMLGDGPGDNPVKIERMENRAVFRVGGLMLSTQLINMPFPDYLRPIPTRFTHTITLDVDGLEGALRRSMVMAAEATRWVRVTASGGLLTATGRNQDGGQSSDEVDAEIEAHEDADDPTFLIVGSRILDVLSRIRTESVVIKFSGEKTPFLMLETGLPESLFLLLPSTTGA